MKLFKKLVTILGLLCIFSCTNMVYATEADISQIAKDDDISNDSDESLEESSETEDKINEFAKYTEIGMKDENDNTLVYIDNNRHIFYDIEYDLYYDENGTVDKKDLYDLGILTDEREVAETLADAKEIQLNLSTDFANFNVEDSTLYDIYVVVTGEPRYVNEEELTKEYANILLSRTNDFTANTTINVTDKKFIMTAYVVNDEVNAYRVSIDEEEYGYKEFDSTSDTYEIKLHVMVPEGAITDTNLAPTLSETDKKYIDGSYGESRREELKESLRQEENPEQPREPAEIETNILGIIVLSSIIGFIAIAGIGIYLWRKKIEED